MHKLMIKTHIDTKFKYLCYTTKTGAEYDAYLGSGTDWKSHLNLYGKNISTTLIFESKDYNKFVEYAIKKSLELDIVSSSEWANLRIEDGSGGDTVSHRMWITDGPTEKYILKIDKIPVGWKRGRSDKCIFKNKEMQKILSSRSDRQKAGISTSKTWKSGKLIFLSIIITKKTYCKSAISRYFPEFKQYY